MPDYPREKVKIRNQDQTLTSAKQTQDRHPAIHSSVYQVTSVPWYYPVLIKVLKPFYHFALWRRHKKRDQLANTSADYNDEINARFAREYPDPPHITNDTALTSRQAPASLETQTLTRDKNKNRDGDALYTNAPCIWCHAVSLGETNTIAPMLNALLQKGATVWLTNTTQTGFARGQTLFSEAIKSNQLVHTFVPIDDKKVIKRFLQHAQPDMAMFVETELWATTLALLAQSSIPSVLVNGRLSVKSYINYQKFRAVSRSMMHNLTLIIAQDNRSAQRFISLGAEPDKVKVADSLKWSTGAGHSFHSQQPNKRHKNRAEADLPNPSTNKVEQNTERKFAENSLIFDRPIWVAGSTHEGEENIVLKAHQRLVQQQALDNALFILVPRHPERFEAVADLVRASGLEYRIRSKGEVINETTQVYLADTMGELQAIYQLADVALIGGSLVDVGGHNPVEAARYAAPIIMGKYTQSCDEVVSALQDVGALQVVNSSDDDEAIVQLEALLNNWLLDSHKLHIAGCRGQELVLEKSGAMEQQLQLVESLLSAR